jgi:hypothetical protein
MPLKFTKSTDTAHKIKLESELIVASWVSGVAYIGLTAKFVVRTAFVGNGAPVEVKGKTQSGKKLGKVKGFVTNNCFTGALEIPDNIKEGDFALFEVDISKCGLNGQSDGIPVYPPILVQNLKWSAKEARRGDIVSLSADVPGLRDDTDVKLTIYEYDRDGVHDRITELAAKSKGQKVKLDWKYEYHEDTDEIPTDEELKKYGKKYNPPEYFFTVKIEENEFGKKQESGLLLFKDWIEIRLTGRGGTPVPDADYVLTMPDGSQRKGKLDGNGYAVEKDVPPGNITIEFPNQKGQTTAVPKQT